MSARPTESPSVEMALAGHPPASARLGVAPRTSARRAVEAAAVLLLTAAAAVAAAGVPPHYPWPGLAVVAGIPLARFLWRWELRVRWFMGICPRCRGALHRPVGAPVRLPERIRCAGCGASPELRARAPEPHGPPPGLLRHLRPECTGRWDAGWLWDESFLHCRACGARCAADAALRRAAEAENRNGELIVRLAEEGRFL